MSTRFAHARLYRQLTARHRELRVMLERSPEAGGRVSGDFWRIIDLMRRLDQRMHNRRIPS